MDINYSSIETRSRASIAGWGERLSAAELDEGTGAAITEMPMVSAVEIATEQLEFQEAAEGVEPPLQIESEELPLEMEGEEPPLEMEGEEPPLEMEGEEPPLEMEGEEPPLEMEGEEAPLKATPEQPATKPKVTKRPSANVALSIPKSRKTKPRRKRPPKEDTE